MQQDYTVSQTDTSHAKDYFIGRRQPRLFDHVVTESYPGLKEKVKDVLVYAGRAYALTHPQDAIILPSAIREYFPVIHHHYERVGLETTDHIIWDSPTDIHQLLAAHVYDPYLYNDYAYRLTHNKPLYQAVKLFNNKNLFIKWCERNKFPVPVTQAYAKGEVPLRTGEGPWFIKGAVSASGAAVVRAKTWEEVLLVSATMIGDFQIQEEIQADTFLNAQYFADESGRVSYVAATTQILDNFQHIGNCYPASTRGFRSMLDPVADAAGVAGLRGIFAFDVAARAARNGTDYFIIECNPRPNAVTYPTGIMMRLGLQGNWVSIKIRISVDQKKLETILKKLEYKKSTGTGVVVTTWGMRDKLGIMVVGSDEQQKKILHEISNLGN